MALTVGNKDPFAKTLSDIDTQKSPTGKSQVTLDETQAFLSELGIKPGTSLSTEQLTKLQSLLKESKENQYNKSGDATLSAAASSYLGEVIKQKEAFNPAKQNWMAAALAIPGLASADSEQQVRQTQGASTVENDGVRLTNFPRDAETLQKVSNFVAQVPELKALLSPPGPAAFPGNKADAGLADKRWQVWGAALEGQLKRMDDSVQKDCLSRLGTAIGREQVFESLLKEPGVAAFQGASAGLSLSEGNKWPESLTQIAPGQLRYLRSELSDLKDKFNASSGQKLSLEGYLEQVVLKDPNLPPNGRMLCALSVHGYKNIDAKGEPPKMDPEGQKLAASLCAKTASDMRQAVNGKANEWLQSASQGVQIPTSGTLWAGKGQFTPCHVKSDGTRPNNHCVALSDIDYQSLALGKEFRRGINRASEQVKSLEITGTELRGGFSVMGAESAFRDGGNVSFSVGGTTLNIPIVADDVRTRSDYKTANPKYEIKAQSQDGQVTVKRDEKYPNISHVKVALNNGETAEFTIDPLKGTFDFHLPEGMVGSEMRVGISTKDRTFNNGGEFVDEVGLDYWAQGLSETPPTFSANLRAGDNYENNVAVSAGALQMSESDKKTMDKAARRIESYFHKHGELPPMQLNLFGDGEAKLVDGKFVVGEGNLDNAEARALDSKLRLNEDGSVYLELHGYTSQAGDTQYNYGLSGKRVFGGADKMMNELLKYVPKDVAEQFKNDLLAKSEAKLGAGIPQGQIAPKKTTMTYAESLAK